MDRYLIQQLRNYLLRKHPIGSYHYLNHSIVAHLQNVKMEFQFVNHLFLLNQLKNPHYQKRYNILFHDFIILHTGSKLYHIITHYILAY